MTEDDAGLSLEDLAAILKREFDEAESYHEQLEPIQDSALKYYEAQPFGNEIEGRSQIVLPDVQETLDYMQQSVLRTFLSGDRVIEFEATEEEDEAAADDATAAIDYRFMREQDGARVLGDVLTDGNLNMYGVFKALCDYEEKVSRTWVEMPALALEMVEGDIEDVRELEPVQGPQGEPMEMVRALVKTQTTKKNHKLVAVPVDEFRFSPNAKHEDTADYLAHVRPMSRSALVEMGFDPEQVAGLPKHGAEMVDHNDSELDYHRYDHSSDALEEVLLCEEYARIDVDGDGIAERVKCFRVENEIMRWRGEEPEVDEETGEPVMDDEGQPVLAQGEVAIETVDEQPFAVFCPFPRPHRLVGYALAHKVMDIQLGRSEVARQLFDGMAYSNMPRLLVDENLATDETMDDVLNPLPGSPIRGRAGAVTPVPHAFSIGDSLSAMEWMTGERESRTGITRMNQGLDADTLNKTAAGTAMMQAAGQQFEEAIAYQLASAFARGCAKLYRQMRVEGEPFTIKVDGKYRQIDPSTWPETVNLRIRVGLGTNGKDKRIQARMALLEPLTLAMQEGMAGHEHAFNWFDGVARDMGIGQGDDFLFDPTDEKFKAKKAQEAEQPDPAIVEIQGKLQLERDKMQQAGMLKSEEAQFNAELKWFEMQERIGLEAMKASGQFDLGVYKTQLEARIGEMKARFEAATKANMTEQRMGGSVAS